MQAAWRGRPGIRASLEHRARRLALKRAVDVAGAAGLLVLCAPVLIAASVAIAITSPGPILFRQERVGQHGRPFVLLKLRSMFRGSDQVSPELRQLNEMAGPVFKVRCDPRVTPVGRWLRMWSLDELPQLWNVLRGDMSLVGPRPPLPAEVAQYAPEHRRRLAMKPGLTGPWQVAGRNQVDFREWMALDLDYVEHWTLAADFRILARTLPAVLSRRGAW